MKKNTRETPNTTKHTREKQGTRKPQANQRTKFETKLELQVRYVDGKQEAATETEMPPMKEHGEEKRGGRTDPEMAVTSRGPDPQAGRREEAALTRRWQ